jgi:hypothetical protein
LRIELKFIMLSLILIVNLDNNRPQYYGTKHIAHDHVC